MATKKSSGRKQQKLTAKQKEARMKAAQERKQAEEAAKARKERKKRIFTIVVCVILVLALGIPTMALAVLSA